MALLLPSTKISAGAHRVNAKIVFEIVGDSRATPSSPPPSVTSDGLKYSKLYRIYFLNPNR